MLGVNFLAIGFAGGAIFATFNCGGEGGMMVLIGLASPPFKNPLCESSEDLFISGICMRFYIEASLRLIEPPSLGKKGKPRRLSPVLPKPPRLTVGFMKLRLEML